MKKSWHPLLLKNQERVWLEEKKALEEKKKLDQLRKEKEEERQLQELQRLQEEKTGKKRTEKLEWMYATPATGTSQNPNDLEDYLLGKKRVDKILTADEHAKLGASHKNFIAVQNANSARDVAAKVREDPLLAIKQQEQAAYQALLSNPLRLRELQEKAGIKPKKEKRREKEERRRLRAKKHRHRSDSRSRSSHRSRSPDRSRRSSGSPTARTFRPPARSHLYLEDKHSRRSRSPRWDAYRGRSDDSEDHRRPRRDRSPPRVEIQRRRSPDSTEPSYGKRHVQTRSPPPRSNKLSQTERQTSTEANRAARLAAMSSSAMTMTAERRERLAALLEKEKTELEREEQLRKQSGGLGSFISQEQKRVFGGQGGLEDRIRRSRGGMVIDAD